jgi:hypothetical protein
MKKTILVVAVPIFDFDNSSALPIYANFPCIKYFLTYFPKSAYTLSILSAYLALSTFECLTQSLRNLVLSRVSVIINTL